MTSAGPRRILPGDEAHARNALDLAALAIKASPNPRVGAVVVRQDQVVGRGSHEYALKDHAEIVALREAGELARGATLFVSLEPCSSAGRTPACTEAVVAAGISRVVACMSDPNPKHAGRGLRELRRAGVEVAVGVLREEAVRLNERWIAHLRRSRPHVTVKLATSIDGRIAAASGDSRWITGPLARERVHRQRREADAVIVGAGTLLADDPRLTVRLPAASSHGPLRCVLDPQLACPPSARLLMPMDEREGGGSVILFTREDLSEDTDRRERAESLAGAGAEIVPVASAGDRLDLAAVLRVLEARRCVGVLVEGGAHVAGAFLASRLVDRILLHVGPLVLGGDGTVAAFAGFGAGSLAEAPRLKHLRCEQAGDDVALEAVVDGGFDPVEEAEAIARLDESFS